MIFDSVEGVEKKHGRESSLYNEEEIREVMEWLEKLRKTGCDMADIGVISPYKAQCQRIQEDLNTFGMNKVTVGVAEHFQGQERRVIIISTVRNSRNLGFVGNEQVRFFSIKTKFK